jgi:hypothetical protein
MLWFAILATSSPNPKRLDADGLSLSLDALGRSRDKTIAYNEAIGLTSFQTPMWGDAESSLN